MALRVLHVDTGREMRGGQRQVLLLLNGLRSAGIACTLLAREGSPLFNCATEAEFPVYPPGLRNLLLHSRPVDLVHAHDAHAHTQAALVSRAPFVVSRRVAFPVKRSLLSGLKYRLARRYLAVSEFVASELADAHIPRTKIDVVYDGIDPYIKPGAWRRDGPVVALASTDPAKGGELVGQAARLARLDITYSQNLNLDLQRASMFVYITQAEGFGSAVLLAMAMGIPVIASDIGGLSEALCGGNAGLLVANEAAKIAQAMQRLRDDSLLAQTLIKRGRETVAKQFTVQRMVDCTIESYRSALAV